MVGKWKNSAVRFLRGRILKREPILQPGNRIGTHDPNYTFNASQIALIHIPRTGGSTLHHLLQRIDPSLFVNLNTHRPVSSFCSPMDYDYITFLRSPVDRVMSLYRTASHETSPFHEHWQRGIENFMQNCWEARNMACRYLTGNLTDEVNVASLSQAKLNLRQFLFAGLFEEYNEEVFALLSTLGFGSSRLSLPRLNTSIAVEPFEFEAVIASYNTYDIALYDWFLEQRNDQAWQRLRTFSYK